MGRKGGEEEGWEEAMSSSALLQEGAGTLVMFRFLPRGGPPGMPGAPGMPGSPGIQNEKPCLHHFLQEACP